jgi:SAM-dependent methyltransferase
MPAPDMPGVRSRGVRAAIALLRPLEFAITSGRCTFCGHTLFVRLRRDELGVRCIRCGSSAVHLSLGAALERHMPELKQRYVCELSARGPLVSHLRRRARSVALSEYFAGVSPGDRRDGVRCEDVQRLTYADASFDLVTHTEVLEHVPDDARAQAELRRVLRPGGLMLFTVPLQAGATVERAVHRDGDTVHLHPPSYHGDPLRGGTGILVFRDYGQDIVARLLSAGFGRAWIDPPSAAVPWGYGRAVICATSPGGAERTDSG